MDVNFSRIIESIISSTVGGLFTIVGVFLTIRYYRRKDDVDRKIHLFENRPNLVQIENAPSEPDLHLIILPFQRPFPKDNYVEVSYDKNYAKKTKLEFNDYTFRNIGKSEISTLHVIMNQKTWGSIVEIDNDYYSHFINAGSISYYVAYDRRVLPGEVVKIRFYHKKGKVISGLISAILTISLHDEYDNIWGQLFFYPQNNLYPSTSYSSIGNYREDTRPRNIERYFSDI